MAFSGAFLRSPGVNANLYNSVPITLTAGQTSVTGLVYTPGLTLFMKNGVLLEGNGNDITATDGQTATLTSPAKAGDILRVISLSGFSFANAVPLAGNVSLGGPLVLSGGDTLGSRPARFDSSQKLVDSGFVQDIVGSGYYGTAFTLRNKIINGNFDIWQRGTSQTAAGYGSVDRWYLGLSGSTATVSQQTFTLGQTAVPNNPSYWYRANVTSVAGAGNYAVLVHAIESVKTLSGKTVTVSLWAKADSNKNIAAELYQFFGTGGSPSADNTNIGTTTLALTTSWQKFTFTTTVPSISGKTIGTNGNDALKLYIWVDAGSSYNSQTNSLGQQSGTFDIAQVQLEEGPIATVFESRPAQVELALCQRYCERFTATGYALSYGVGMTSTGTVAYCRLQYKVRKRANPTFYSSATSTLTFFSAATGSIIPSSLTGTCDLDGAMLTVGISGGTGGQGCGLEDSGSGNSYIQFDAEI